MEPFIAEFALNDTTALTSEGMFIFDGDTPAINGGLDRDIIRRVAKDHALEEKPEDPDVFATEDTFVFDDPDLGTPNQVTTGEDEGESTDILTALLLPALSDDADGTPRHETGAVVVFDAIAELGAEYDVTLGFIEI